MKIYTQLKIQSLSAKVCDRCGLKADEKHPEFQEFLSIDRVAAFGSVFGDGEHIQLDLCQNFLKATLGEWINKN